MFKVLILTCLISQLTSLNLEVFENQNSLNENSKNFENSNEISHARFKRRNGKKATKYHWSNATIPFVIDSAFITLEHEATVYEAMKMIENTTCVRFVNYTNERDFVLITGGEGACVSKIGRRGGKQIVKLVKPNGIGCFTPGKILHEFLHLLGFYHFHRSPDRDDHIKINWNNVKSGYEYDLSEKSDEVTDFGTPYDYDSLLHVKNTKYSKNGEITIETINPQNRDRIGQRIKLSEGDILRINRMYKCDEI